MTEDIVAKIRRVLREQLRVDDASLAPESAFVEDLGADSLSLIELTLALEVEFDIEITEEDAERIRTVTDVIHFIESATRRRPVDRLRSS